MKDNKITEQDAIAMGFTFHHAYNHDDWITRRYTKAHMEIEFTYVANTGQLQDISLAIDELFIEDLQLDKLQKLNEALS